MFARLPFNFFENLQLLTSKIFDTKNRFKSIHNTLITIISFENESFKNSGSQGSKFEGLKQRSLKPRAAFFVQARYSRIQFEKKLHLNIFIPSFNEFLIEKTN